jgi:hypothetical protein
VAHRELSRATAAAVGRAAKQRRESGRERHQRVRGGLCQHWHGGGERGSCHARGRTGRGRCASHVLGKCAGDIEHAEAVAVEKAPHVVVATDLPSILKAMCAGMGPESLDSLAERKPELRPMAAREKARERGRAHARHLHARRRCPKASSSSRSHTRGTFVRPHRSTMVCGTVQLAQTSARTQRTRRSTFATFMRASRQFCSSRQARPRRRVLRGAAPLARPPVSVSGRQSPRAVTTT